MLDRYFDWAVNFDTISNYIYNNYYMGVHNLNLNIHKLINHSIGVWKYITSGR